MSRKASECSSSKTVTAPARFETILQKMQSSFMSPFLLPDLVSLVCPPGKIEQEAGQPVHIRNRFGINRFYLRERYDPPLGSPTDGAGNVKLSSGDTSGRKNESSQRLQHDVNRVNCFLQIVNVGFADAWNVRADKLRSKIPAKREKILLDGFQNLLCFCVPYNRPR